MNLTNEEYLNTVEDVELFKRMAALIDRVEELEEQVKEKEDIDTDEYESLRAKNFHMELFVDDIRDLIVRHANEGDTFYDRVCSRLDECHAGLQRI